ncbi:hypothetical protein KSF78_0008853 [Schistosoma japonicum]|nr:hypothetical protein KSF78_0008853 [Schistosoma japonicum]
MNNSFYVSHVNMKCIKLWINGSALYISGIAYCLIHFFTLYISGNFFMSSITVAYIVHITSG